MLASVIGPVIYGNQVITAGRTEYHDGVLGLRFGYKQDERSLIISIKPCVLRSLALARDFIQWYTCLLYITGCGVVWISAKSYKPRNVICFVVLVHIMHCSFVNNHAFALYLITKYVRVCALRLNILIRYYYYSITNQVSPRTYNNKKCPQYIHRC